MIRKPSLRTTATLELFSPDQSLTPTIPQHANRLCYSTVLHPSDKPNMMHLESCDEEISDVDDASHCAH